MADFDRIFKDLDNILDSQKNSENNSIIKDNIRTFRIKVLEESIFSYFFKNKEPKPTEIFIAYFISKLSSRLLVYKDILDLLIDTLAYPIEQIDTYNYLKDIKLLKLEIYGFSESLDDYIRYRDLFVNSIQVEHPYMVSPPSLEEPKLNMERLLEIERKIYNIFKVGYYVILPKIVNNILKSLLSLYEDKKQIYIENIMKIRSLEDLIYFLNTLSAEINVEIPDNTVNILKEYLEIERLYLNIVEELKKINKTTFYYPEFYKNLLHENI